MSTAALLGTARPLSGNATITTLAAVDVGDVILLFGQGNAAITASAISDSGAGGGNAYTPTLGSATGAPVLCGYRAYSVATKALPVGSTITIDNTGGKTRQSHVAVVVKNPVDTAPVDKSNATQGSSGTASTGATGTLGQAQEFIVAGFHAISPTDPAVVGTGWTKLGSVTTNGGANDRSSVVYVKEVASTATSTPTATFTSANWAGQVITVKTEADPPPADGYEWSQWNGTTEVPLTVAGVWDGSAIQPLDPDATTVT